MTVLNLHIKSSCFLYGSLAMLSRQRIFEKYENRFFQKLRNIPYLYVFLIAPDNDAPCVIGWGHKTTADKARRYAARNNLPYIALEDGFLRSLDLSCKGAQPLSLVVDHTGIYYDAGEPSDLENLLNASGWETPELMDSAGAPCGTSFGII